MIPNAINGLGKSGPECAASQLAGLAFAPVTFAVAAAIGLLYAAAPAMAQEKITVWWVKGFYKSEDDALNEAIKKFEAKTGVKVELSQYADSGHDPEDGGGARFRHAAGCRLCRFL